MKITPHAKTVDGYLKTKGLSLAEFIQERREEGLSFHRIAQALYAATEGIVDVTGQTISNWADMLGLPEEVAS